MEKWSPVLISCIALVFTIFSFWWMNWRPAKLQVGDLRHFAAGKATAGLSNSPNLLVVALPLILHNSGARPLVIESIRLVEVSRSRIGTFEFVGVDSHLGTPPFNERVNRDYFRLPLALKANEITKANFIFERPAEEFNYTNALYHFHLEAKLSGLRDWHKVKDIELNFLSGNEFTILGLNNSFQIFDYMPNHKFSSL
jgi:hypothetical protein